MKLLSITIFSLLLFNTAFSQDGSKNPAAEGFRSDISEKEAIAIANEVMEAMGGREQWDKTRFLSWNFFGRRAHLWDRYSGDIRIEIPDGEVTILMNINSGKGMVRKGNTVFQQKDSLEKYLDLGKRLWINDSYWLVMPFKLKDSGVALKKVDEINENPEGRASDVLQLTFEEVGVTPENKYHVFVDKETRLVNYWAFFKNSDQVDPDFSTPWTDYEQFNGILLSGNRGRNKLSDIAVHEKVEPEKFSKF